VAPLPEQQKHLQLQGSLTPPTTPPPTLLPTHPLAVAAARLSAQSEGTSGDDEEMDDDNDNDVESVPMFQCKSTVDSVLDGGDIDLGDISYGRPNNYNEDDNILTDATVSKFSYHQRLTHYMDGVKISQQNRKVVELVILVKAGTTVQNMNPMKKSSHKEVLLWKYMQIINEIEDIHFEDESVRASMLAGYKGAKKSLTGATY
jgi:hypothetical protein